GATTHVTSTRRSRPLPRRLAAPSAAPGGPNYAPPRGDLKSGGPLGPPLQHRGPVKALAFSPDGQFLAAGVVVADRDERKKVIHPVAGEARLWHVATGQPLGAALAHPRPVWTLAFSPNGPLLLTGSEDRHA